jgi:hypothetical protein
MSIASYASDATRPTPSTGDVTTPTRLPPSRRAATVTSLARANPPVSSPPPSNSTEIVTTSCEASEATNIPCTKTGRRCGWIDIFGYEGREKDPKYLHRTHAETTDGHCDRSPRRSRLWLEPDPDGTSSPPPLLNCKSIATLLPRAAHRRASQSHHGNGDCHRRLRLRPR